MGPQEEDYHSNDPQPAKRLSGIVDNVWEWAFRISSQSPVQPIVNLGHGMIEFNPPPFIVQAHQNALLKVDCNQYGPTLGRTRLKTALARTYSRLYDAPLDGDRNIAITTGATAAILSSLMAFIEHGDEVIVIEPLFNLYAYLINFVGGVVKPVTLHPPTDTFRSRMLADDWRLNMKELGDAIGPRTKMLIINTP
ncbi:MAG: hypothetical protein L6R36_003912 [Xanthoria steineri]|nr:MAG: hypothetical protein L6R36_003912 [Xanthoria steineri]